MYDSYGSDATLSSKKKKLGHADAVIFDSLQDSIKDFVTNLLFRVKSLGEPALGTFLSCRRFKGKCHPSLLAK